MEDTQEFYQDDILFRVPSQWFDQTVALYVAPRQESAYPPKFLLTRHPSSPQEDVASFARKTLAQLSKRLAGFELAEEGPSRLARHAAHAVLFGLS